MPSYEKEHSRLRRGRQAEGGASADFHLRSLTSLPLKYVGVGLLTVVLICSWQFVLLTRHLDPREDTSLEGVDNVLWMHESNITALASQQRELVVLAVRLGEQLQEQHKEIVALRAQLSPGGAATAAAAAAASQPMAIAGDAGGGAGGAGAYGGEALRQQLDLVREQDHRMSQLQNAMVSLASQVGRGTGGWPGSQPQPQPHPLLRGGAAFPGLAAAPGRPPGAASTGSLPEEWLQRFSQQELLQSAQEADRWRKGVQDAFRHVWRSYRERAWGKDEIRPVTGAEGRRWGGLGLMILDSLSTMWVLGLTAEFDEATRWVETSLRFDQPGYVSFFETTIRALGGLISAHSLSGREVFLRKAQELADRMMPAFAHGEPGFPTTQVDLSSGAGKTGWFSGAVLAEAGTVQLEFRYISQHTGNPSYAAAADRAMRSILRSSGGRGLVPWGLSRTAPVRAVNQHVTLGAMGDSYYEYLLKMYIQTGGTEREWKDAWVVAMRAMQARLVKRTSTGLTYVSEEQNGVANNKMDHLVCFVGGMLIYGSRTLPRSERDPTWERDAAAITETCYQMYQRMPTHLAPEAVRFDPRMQKPHDMQVWSNAHQCLLRPETAESIFYMFYYTGDPKYRRMAGEIFQAIETHARTTFGYSAVLDVRQPRPTLKNELETFFLAETLKYLYLTFVPNPREVINLDEFVFNTEAHPIRIHRR